MNYLYNYYMAQILIFLSKIVDGLLRKARYLDRFDQNECLPQFSQAKKNRAKKIKQVKTKTFYTREKLIGTNVVMNYIPNLGANFKFRGLLKYRWYLVLLCSKFYNKLDSCKSSNSLKGGFALSIEKNWSADDEIFNQMIMDGFINPLVIFPLQDIDSKVKQQLLLPSNQVKTVVVDLSCFHGVEGHNGRSIHPAYGVFYQEKNTNPDSWLLHSLAVVRKNGSLLNFLPKECTKPQLDYAKTALLTAISRHQQQLIHIYFCHVIQEVLALHFIHSISKNHPVYRILHYFIRFIHHNALLGRVSIFDEQRSATAKFTALRPEPMLTMAHDYFGDDYSKYTIHSHPGRTLNLKYHQYGLAYFNFFKANIEKILTVYYRSSRDFEGDTEVSKLFRSLQGGFPNIEGTVFSSLPLKPDLDALIQLITDLVYNTVILHQLTHVGQKIIASNPILAPASLYKDVPDSLSQINKQYLFECLPKKGEAIKQTFWTSLTCHNYTGFHRGYANAFSNQASNKLYAEFMQGITTFDQTEGSNKILVEKYPFMKSSLLSPQTF